MSADKQFCLVSNIGDVGAKLFCSERTVETDAEEIHVRYRIQERFDGLPGKSSAACIGDRSRDHNGNILSGFFKKFLNCKKRGLCIQRIEYCFYEKDINASVKQSSGLLTVCIRQLIEADSPESRIVHIRRERGCPVCGAD